MPEASPAKWHLAHTTWFFEAFVLAAFEPGYRAFDPAYAYLFNSYYDSVGPMHPRPERGLLSQPSLEDVYAYRRHVDQAIGALSTHARFTSNAEALATLELGCNHEQQHQELILTDIKHAFSRNPLRPAYRIGERFPVASSSEIAWILFPSGLRRIGAGPTGFAFDNERPRHRAFVEAFALADRPVTNQEYAAFIDSGGYARSELWLSEGWRAVHEGAWSAPLYWLAADGGWKEFTLAGVVPLDPSAPVCHVSFYEADAYARWAGARLPTEAEWEVAADHAPIEGNLLESGALHPRAVSCGNPDPARPRSLFGDVWEWTASPYVAYPGYRPPAGPLGEYNGKFMSNQMVLRGGSCATPASHVRASYRNFFPPAARWQFSGIRLARDGRGAR
jgi:ergothioneine biosynthesis protein EgtB